MYSESGTGFCRAAAAVISQHMYHMLSAPLHVQQFFSAVLINMRTTLRDCTHLSAEGPTDLKSFTLSSWAGARSCRRANLPNIA